MHTRTHTHTHPLLLLPNMRMSCSMLCKWVCPCILRLFPRGSMCISYWILISGPCSCLQSNRYFIAHRKSSVTGYHILLAPWTITIAMSENMMIDWNCLCDYNHCLTISLSLSLSPMSPFSALFAPSCRHALCPMRHSISNFSTNDQSIFDESGMTFTDTHIDNRADCMQLTNTNPNCIQMKSEPSGASSPDSSAETSTVGPDDCAACGRLIQVSRLSHSPFGLFGWVTHNHRSIDRPLAIYGRAKCRTRRS